MQLSVVSFAVVVGLAAAALAQSSTGPAAPAADVRPEGHVDWPAFLARHDLVWTRVPDAKPGDAPFLADAAMGTMLRQTGPNELTWLVSSQDVEDRREIPLGHSRLPSGDLRLYTVGAITGADLRLSLWNAELTGTVTTANGTIGLRAIVHATEPVIFIELTPSDGEKSCRWGFDPAQAVNPRVWTYLGLPAGDLDAIDLKTAKLRNEKLRTDLLAYPKNPKPTTGQLDGTAFVHQQLQNGEHATAWQETTAGPVRRLYISTAYAWGRPESGRTRAAVDVVRHAAATPVDAFFATHRAWWHDYYPKSFCTFGDPYWESFYWVQLYKFACATRADAPVLDNQGPWLLPTPWSGTWWNLNVQLSYSMPFTANHADVGDSLRRGLTAHVQSLIDTVPEQFRADSAAVSRATAHDLHPWSANFANPMTEPPEELGNLTWALHDVWRQYRMSMDDRILRDDVVPLLRRSTNYAMHHLTPGPDGRLHLPVLTSPEYGKTGPDTNYNLSLLRWGLRTLIAADDRLKLNDPLRAKWQDTLDRLTDYPQDENGYLIAAGLPYSTSHRHYSHLLMIYPLALVNVDNGGREMIEKAVAHWQSLPKALLGYSFTGSASMYAYLGDGDRAIKQLNGLRHFIQPNSMYFESGPVLETPFAACQSIHDMLLQSWAGPRGSVLRIFPAVPTAWPDAAFADWRAEGAFAVGAARAGGKTQWVTIESMAGEPCLVRPGFDGPPVIRNGPAGVEVQAVGDGVYSINLKRGDRVTLTAADDSRPIPLAPVEPTAPRQPFGYPGPAGPTTASN